MICLFYLSTFSVHIGSVRKDAERVFNAKKQYTVTQHRLSEIGTNTLKSVRYNQYLQAYKDFRNYNSSEKSISNGSI